MKRNFWAFLGIWWGIVCGCQAMVPANLPIATTNKAVTHDIFGEMKVISHKTDITTF
ncbi:MAG: hypothetical protein IJT08_02785 [Alphaproteobacteria bacterium]|nr:hypothetical protein [Alphaproteobacteria bacterium]